MIVPPSPDELASRLKDAGKLAEDKIQEAKDSAAAELEHSKNEDHFYDTVITNDSLDNAYSSFEKFIYGAKTNGVSKLNGAPAGEDEAMNDTTAAEVEGEPEGGEANVPIATIS